MAGDWADAISIVPLSQAEIIDLNRGVPKCSKGNLSSASQSQLISADLSSAQVLWCQWQELGLLCSSELPRKSYSFVMAQRRRDESGDVKFRPGERTAG